MTLELGLFPGAQTASDQGVYNVSVLVDDSSGGTDQQDYSLTIYEPNVAPEILSSPLTKIVEGQSYSYDISASDPNLNDELTFVLNTAPTGMTIDSSTGEINWSGENIAAEGVRTNNINCETEISSNNANFDPVLKWQWVGPTDLPDANHVASSPVVGQLTDDNGDGEIDQFDTPDVVFLSRDRDEQSSPIVLNVVNGDDGAEIFAIYSDSPGLSQFGLGTAALGDIDNDGLLEIVILGRIGQELMAFEHDGTLKWNVPTNKHNPGNLTTSYQALLSLT